MDKKVSSESVVKNNRRRTRKKYSSEEKIRIVLSLLSPASQLRTRMWSVLIGRIERRY
jgi:hypothetical protein